MYLVAERAEPASEGPCASHTLARFILKRAAVPHRHVVSHFMFLMQGQWRALHIDVLQLFYVHAQQHRERHHAERWTQEFRVTCDDSHFLRGGGLNCNTP